MTAQNATSSPVAKKEPTPLMRFFANPVVGMVGTLASILGVLLAVYFYVQSIRFREVVYYVNPAQAIVVKTGQASRLHVLIGDRELKSDVTTAQIAIWNRGTESVKPAEVLTPVTVRTTPSVPILEATLRKKSRDAVDIALDQKHLEDGVLGISWNILEQGDGGVIQIVYAGNPDNTRVTVLGVIEGQHGIRQLQYTGEIKSAADQVRRGRWDLFGFAFEGFVGILALASALLIWYKSSSLKESWWMLLLGLLWLGLAIYHFLSQAPEPPFGF